MGSGSSTPRNITIEEETGGVVKVSEAVARRLVGKPELPERSSPAGDQTKRVTVTRVVPDDQLEAELEKIRSHYEKKIRMLEKHNREVHQTTVDEFAKVVEEVEKKFIKPATNPGCDDLQNKVIQCYKDHPKQVLNCSQMVRAYSACVEHERSNVLKNKDFEFYVVS